MHTWSSDCKCVIIIIFIRLTIAASAAPLIAPSASSLWRRASSLASALRWMGPSTCCCISASSLNDTWAEHDPAVGDAKLAGPSRALKTCKHACAQRLTWTQRRTHGQGNTRRHVDAYASLPHTRTWIYMQTEADTERHIH
jgi:hypothetical protein